MSKLVPPHGGKGLVIRLLDGAEKDAELKKAAGLKQIEITSQEKGDLIMIGIGAFSPLAGFMTKADWKGVCEKFTLADGTFWPVPVMLSVSDDDFAGVKVGDEVALVRGGDTYATMKVEEKFALTEDEKKWESEMVYKGNGEDSEKFWDVALEDHPGVQMVMARKNNYLAGPVKVLSEGDYPTNPKYLGVYLRPGRNPQDLRGPRLEERGRHAAAQPHAPLPRAPVQDRPRRVRRRHHPLPDRQPEARRHPG